jgi:hypothetical protein
MPELDPLEFYGFLTPKVRAAICAVTTQCHPPARR